MMIKRTLVAPALVAGVALATGGWLLQRDAALHGADGATGSRVFDEVLQHVSDEAVDPHSQAELYRMATQGMVEALGDPHSVYLTAEEYARLHQQTTGQYAGLGIYIGKHEGWITAVGVLPESPAERAGVQVGDRLVSVDGKSTEGLNEDQAVKDLRGPAGSSVRILLQRVGSAAPAEVRMVREELHVRSVPYAYLLDDRVGYVQLTVFSQSSTAEVRAAVDSLRGAGMRSLVLDLRGNPGGLLDEGVGVADLFLPAGKPVVETRARDPRENETLAATTPDRYAGIPVAVLVDDFSASAAEIVAGALQDHDRALVLGEPTYGKGSVQTLFPLTAGNYLKLTTARWYTPSGRSIQKDHSKDDEDASAAGADDGDSAAVVVAPQSAAPAVADTAKRVAYRTDAGRVVFGGGGIVPDVIVRPDTADPQVRAFFAAAGKVAGGFSDAVFRYAVEFARAHPDLPRGFAVTPKMRAVLFARLRAAGVDATPRQYAAATPFLDRRLVHQVAAARWGAAAAERRDDESDPVVREALRRLHAAPTQQALLQAAAVAAVPPRTAARH
ncbi:MAG: carboxyl-terminal protease [Gemmatimonadetes bacterium]|nr:carboxyl-terminal protease [Gemmatimonadota bacterium]